MSTFRGFRSDHTDLTGEAALLREEANAGDADAQYFYAWYLLMDEGYAVRQNLSQEELALGLKYFRMAAAQGAKDGAAALALADFYYRGEIVPQDYKKARMWYNTACMKNCAPAFCALGDMALLGLDGEIDYEEAARCYLNAAGDFRDAVYRLGDLFARGQFFRQDPELAKRLYQEVLTQEEALFAKYGFYSVAKEQAEQRLRDLEDATPLPCEGDESEGQRQLREQVLALLDAQEEKR